MKNLLLAVLLFLSGNNYAQISVSQGGLLSKEYSKEVTEYRIKKYIVDEVLNIDEKVVIEVKIDAIAATVSGELSTVIYDCKSLGKSGLVLAFWSDQVNEHSVEYTGYSFRKIDKELCNSFFNELENVIEDKLTSVRIDNDNNANNVVYKWEDITFIFYSTINSSTSIRVLWNNFDSEWTKQDFALTKKRFDKHFKVTKK